VPQGRAPLTAQAFLRNLVAGEFVRLVADGRLVLQRYEGRMSWSPKGSDRIALGNAQG